MSGYHDSEKKPFIGILEQIKELFDNYASLYADTSLLEKMIKEHWDLNYKGQEALSKRISITEDHYSSLWKRIKTLEDFIGQNYKVDHSDHDERINDLEKIMAETRLLKLEKENLMRQDTIACIDRAYDKATVNLEKRLDVIENFRSGYYDQFNLNCERFQKIEKAITDWEEEFYFLKDKLRSPESKPHKCPVCDGKGKINFMLPAGSYWEDKCNACEGKGIVWE